MAASFLSSETPLPFLFFPFLFSFLAQAKKVTGNQDGYRFSDLWLWGHCQRLEIDHQYARFTTRAFPLEADSVFIYAEDYRTRSNATIRVRAKEYLNAEINGWTDVLFLGAPKIEKLEYLGGRVVDANRYQ